MNRILFSFLILMFIPSFAYCQTPALSVEVTPNQMTLAPGENFTVNAKIINNSNVEQTINEWGCSYEENWLPDNPLVITYPAWACNKNAMINRAIAAGNSYERKLNLHLSADAHDKVTFKLKFASTALDKDGLPIYGPDKRGFMGYKIDKFIWSNPITITVDKTIPQVQK